MYCTCCSFIHEVYWYEDHFKMNTLNIWLNRIQMKSNTWTHTYSAHPYTAPGDMAINTKCQ